MRNNLILNLSVALVATLLVVGIASGQAPEKSGDAEKKEVVPKPADADKVDPPKKGLDVKVPPGVKLPDLPEVKLAALEIEGTSKRTQKMQDLLDNFKANAKANPGGEFDLKLEKATWSTLKQLLPVLREEGNGLLRDHGKWLGQHPLLLANYERAAPACIEAAKALEQHAKTEVDAEVADAYVAVGGMLRSKAAHYQKLIAKGQDDQAKVAKQIAFVQSGLLFIERIEPIVDVLASTAEQGEATGKYVERLGRFTEAFRTAVRLMHDIGDRLDVPSPGKK